MSKIEFNYSKLRGRIVEKCGTQEEFAKRINKDRSSINLTLNNKRDFTQKEIVAACDVLDISSNDIGQYFFAR